MHGQQNINEQHVSQYSSRDLNHKPPEYMLQLSSKVIKLPQNNLLPICNFSYYHIFRSRHVITHVIWWDKSY